MTGMVFYLQMQVVKNQDGKNILRILWTREENVAALVSDKLCIVLRNGLQAVK